MEIIIKQVFLKILVGVLSNFFLPKLVYCLPIFQSSVSDIKFKKNTDIVRGGHQNLTFDEKGRHHHRKILYIWEPLITQDTNASMLPLLYF